MTFLLDVNALLALGLLSHEFHQRVANWLLTLAAQEHIVIATCAITELGFVRILSQVPAYGYTLQDARSLLLRVKAKSIVPVKFLADDQDLARIPNWVKFPKQLTDGHLAQLAAANDVVFATSDRGIPGAFLIPR